jgi:lysine-specific permease
MGLSIMIIWLLICFTHIRFRKAYLAQGYKLEDLPYRAFLFPYGCYWAIFACIVTIVLYPTFAAINAAENGGNPFVEFLTNFISVPFFGVLYALCKLIKRTSVIPLMDVDLVTGNINLEERRTGAWSSDSERGEKKGAFGRFMEFMA